MGVGVLIVVLAVFVWSQLRTPGGSSSPGLAYFTVDDGKTTFTDSAAKATPFTKDGKEAVRAVMFACDEAQKERFVGFLERSGPVTTPGQPNASVQIRRPGEAEWVPRFSAEGAKILSVRCPNGGTMEPRQVAP